MDLSDNVGGGNPICGNENYENEIKSNLVHN
jgi:hypothetical protein